MPLGFNPIAMLRMKNLFPPQQDDTDDIPNVSDFYHPSTRFSDEYAAALGEMPNREDYKPSMLRKIGAVIAGAGSNDPFETTHRAAMSPYTDAVNQWGLKTKSLEQAAELENRSNVNQRTLALGAVQRAIQEKRANTYDTKTNAAIDTANKNAETARMRAQTAAQRAEIYGKLARGGTMKVDKQGNTWMIYRDGTKENIDLKQFTPEDIQRFKTEGHLSEIDERASAASDLEDKRAKNREKLKQIPTMRPASSHDTTTTYEYDDAGQVKRKTVGATKKRVAVVGPKGEKGTIEEGDTLPAGWKLVGK